MRFTWFRLVSRGLALLFALALVGCSFGGGNTLATPSATPSKNSPIRNSPTRVVLKQRLLASPTIDTLVSQVLTNMHLHAWNPNARTHGRVTGGLYINWKMSNPSITNVTNPGEDGDVDHNHDPQVDLLYLTSLAEYHSLHPQDHTYDNDLSRATSLVLADFQTYSMPKGWVYFSLLKAGTLLNNSDLINTARNVASNFYRVSYDPTLGFVYNRNHTPGVYNTDHTITCGAALLDAGLRWNNQNWVSAGEKTIDHTIAVALDPQYHLFYYSMVVGTHGSDRVGDYKAKAATQGQIVDALLTAYTLVHRQQYLDVATQVMQSLLGPSNMWDSSRGGFYFAFDLSKGAPLTAYKETRGQSLMLLALHHYNQMMQQPYVQQEQQLESVLTNQFYQHTYYGYFYRMTSDYQIFVNHYKHGIAAGVEDYFTTEAMGGTMDALQTIELG